MHRPRSRFRKALGLGLGFIFIAGALLFGLVWLPRGAFHCHPEQQLTQQAIAKWQSRLSQWGDQYPTALCPGSLRELDASFDYGADHKDGWGTAYDLFCLHSERPGVGGVIVRSAGPDRRFDTSDDVVGQTLLTRPDPNGP